MVAIIEDVTEQVRAEQALRESQEKFSLMFRASPAAMAISRLSDGRVIDVNDALAAVCGPADAAGIPGPS